MYPSCLLDGNLSNHSSQLVKVTISPDFASIMTLQRVNCKGAEVSFGPAGGGSCSHKPSMETSQTGLLLKSTFWLSNREDAAFSVMRLASIFDGSTFGGELAKAQ
jgi:hypothetical protein